MSKTIFVLSDSIGETAEAVARAVVSQFEKEFLNFVNNNYPEIIESIKTEKDITNETDEKLKDAIVEFKKNFH